ncbi:hypothetical protein [Agrobacterium pusense]|uniref:hypothetical protein n=1 Tax=Agrobacterium pusense TaxID=648995 RepID=UPI000D1A5447|nr:hypothetical protein [Agrobacterium pusense]
MTRTRIDFTAGDAARFNSLRDQWQAAASACPLSKAGLRVAAVLPKYVSRDFGYAFPTDEQIAADIEKDLKTAKRGIAALDEAKLIEREIKPRFGDGGKVTGKLRRIYLCLPDRSSGQSRPKGHYPKGQVSPKGQKRATEGTDGCPYIPDTHTPDIKTSSGIETSTVSLYARENVPSAYANDNDFLDEFDRNVIAMTKEREIAAGEMSRICEIAFNQTTDSSDMFMPFHWADVCTLRSKETEQWFYQRVGQLIFQRRAA